MLAMLFARVRLAPGVCRQRLTRHRMKSAIGLWYPFQTFFRTSRPACERCCVPSRRFAPSAAITKPLSQHHDENSYNALGHCGSSQTCHHPTTKAGGQRKSGSKMARVLLDAGRVVPTEELRPVSTMAVDRSTEP